MPYSFLVELPLELSQQELSQQPQLKDQIKNTDQLKVSKSPAWCGRSSLALETEYLSHLGSPMERHLGEISGPKNILGPARTDPL